MRRLKSSSSVRYHRKWFRKQKSTAWFVRSRPNSTIPWRNRCDRGRSADAAAGVWQQPIRSVRARLLVGLVAVGRLLVRRRLLRRLGLADLHLDLPLPLVLWLAVAPTIALAIALP